MTICARPIAALDPDERRYIAPCVREAGHVGVCRYEAAALPLKNA